MAQIFVSTWFKYSLTFTKYERLRSPLCHSVYLNDYFEPVLITNEDYDRFAALMLNVFCKKTLLRPTSIDGDSLARAMGLRVRDVRFAFDKDIKGRTYFEEREEALLDDDGNVRLVRVKPGQILIRTKSRALRAKLLLVEPSPLIRRRFSFTMDTFYAKEKSPERMTA